MSFTADTSSLSLRSSKRLTGTSVKDLSSLILRAEKPIASAEVIGPLMEMVSDLANQAEREFKTLTACTPCWLYLEIT